MNAHPTCWNARTASRRVWHKIKLLTASLPVFLTLIVSETLANWLFKLIFRVTDCSLTSALAICAAATTKNAATQGRVRPSYFYFYRPPAVPLFLAEQDNELSDFLMGMPQNNRPTHEANLSTAGTWGASRTGRPKRKLTMWCPADLEVARK
eukprot:131818-Pelagomonas_calceolata.AAC.11